MRHNDYARATISSTNANASNLTCNAFDVTRDAILLTRPACLTCYVDMFYSTILFFFSFFLDSYHSHSLAFIVIVSRIDPAHDLPDAKNR